MEEAGWLRETVFMIDGPGMCLGLGDVSIWVNLF